ncbi:histone-lysine N-methyltransferase 2C isoform X20 [Myotis myotis]|uniref:histone-lysine N-methyltransferase 2C isoform X20 n=1 Tax=Myotis myotis TaxID=51298 RepID=UPI001748621F|nr:histone-lysine N-methyltransferase 2C isoform X20 [Myotis myotis]
MSSEEDKGAEQPQPPPPPPEEPGAPAPSPAAADKRPRGRPRKDGASPFQRARKKPRSRGKTTVEDEDSMDGLETAETENIVETAEIKEQSAEEDAEVEADGSKRLAPAPQRSVSEESASSLVSVGVEAKISEQLCAFCYCGEKSSLGQGDLRQFRVTPGFILPRKNQPSSRKDVDDNSNGTCEKIQNSAPRKHRGQRKERSPQQNTVSCVSVSTQTASDDQVTQLWDELSLVGLPDAIDVQALFDPTGTCWAHHRCVEWSLGVCQMEEPLSVNVDKAVVSGSTERCAFCKHLGATIKCCEEKCTQTYHYPCAVGAGTFQDVSHFFLLCPEHIDQAPERSKEDANCAVCDSPGDLLDQFFCTTCGQHYHGMCLDIAVTPLKRAGWQCPECKVCQNCKQSGEDSKMLVCDTCDKGYHTFCLQPVMKSVPTNGWKCKNCRICVECGTRSSSQWHHNCLVCDSCYQQQDNLCPFCGKCYNPELQKDMLHCNMCKRWIHLECDKPTDQELDSQFREEYICTYCKHLAAAEMDALQPGDGVEMADITADYNNEMEVEGSEDPVVFLEQAVTKDTRGQESTSGIVPDAVLIHAGEQQKSNLPEGLDTQGLLTSESSQDKMHPELENRISHAVDNEKVEMSSKVIHTCDENQNENKMDVSGNVNILAHPVTAQEELQLSEEPQVVASTEESRPPNSIMDSVTIPPETLVSSREDSTVCPMERLAGERVQEEMEKKVSSESSAAFMDFETTPAVESCVKDGLCQDKSVKFPPETELPFPSAVDISKAHAPSSPPRSSDSPSHDMLHRYPSALSASVGNILPTTYFSVTPKIGMGKPAITKRKFSPGRPRSKQGAWSTHNTVSPPSWSPDISEGREIFKPRQLPGSAIWSIKVGRGSGFPGKRRPRGAGLSGRGGRGRSKLKSGMGTVVLPGVSAADISSNKDEEENSMHNTVVLFSSSDKFTLHQDMCVVCGSFGQGAEGRLLACSQCGQCYHPYCVSIKITKVVLSKGWRCLECTVCEACGKATDPGRLLLCDDCDISYHTYCLDPPLQTVPKGGWKCKWCVWCRHCGATSAGLRCEWQNNYTQCAPCASLSSCPICYRNYREEDLILQCRQCDRWMHAICQNLNTEEEVENVADTGFDCSMCRPYMLTSNVPSSECCDSSLVAQIVTKVKELDPPKTYTQDGVCLTESGLTQLQSLIATAPRRKRSKPKLKLKIINQNSVAVLQTPPDIQSEHSRDGEMDDSREGELMDCDGKSESSPEREAVDGEAKGVEGTEGVRKRKRKPYRPGIGGFMVRQRSRTGQGKAKRSVIRKDSSGSISEQLPSRDEGWSEQLPDTLVDESVSVTENTEKIKKRYRKRKNKLEETFPVYLQEAFFGKDLLDTSRQNKLNLDILSEDTAQLSIKANVNTHFLDPSLDPLLSSSSTPAKPGTHGTADDTLADISEVLNTEDDILGIISDDLAKSVDHSAGIDIGPVADDPSSVSQPSVNQSSRPLSEEQLDGILSPELDKMVTDGKIFALQLGFLKDMRAILGKLYKIPELGGKDVEDLFTAVLSPVTPQPTPLPQPPPPPAPQLIPLHNQDVFSRMPLMNGLIGPSPHLPHNSLPPGSGLGTFSAIAQSPYTDARDKNPAFNPMASDPHSSWTSSAPPVEGEGDTMSNAQRSTLKWEKEEALGEMATVAPVLYTNINFPNLKDEFPDWTTRVKQIAKLWRKASSQERAPYVQKARDNRAALRINKVQMSNDSLKRQQQPDSSDPSSRLDSDLFKDPLKQRESEHEQEWKFRQQMRQKSKQQAKIEATQKLEQVKSEQQQQQQQQQQFGSQPLLALSRSDTPSSGIQSPLAAQPGPGNMSPAQSFHKDLFTKQLPSTPTSSSADDVFVKPQAPPPPPTPSRVPLQESPSQPQTSQPPSPQVFSPGSSNSRPPSPVDPYAKMVGTPRPPPGGHSFSRRNSALVESCVSLSSAPRPPQMGEGTANRPSPIRDFCSSSSTSSDPYAKPPDTPRPVTTDQFPKPLGLPRAPIVPEQTAKSRLAAGTNDHFMKPSPRTDVFQRQRIPDTYARPSLTPAPLDSGPGPFKAPMQLPPPSQDPYGPVPHPPRRLSADPYERPALTPRAADNFSHNQSSDPYSQPPLTPRPAMNESFAHPSRAFPQPGTISRPTSQEPYFQPSGPSPSNPDPYSQPPGTPRPSTIDPYSQQPPTPRPPTQADLFVTSATTQRHSDPYAHAPGTPRPGVSVFYSQPPAAPRPRVSEGFARSSVTRPVLMSSQDVFLQAAQNRGTALPGPVVRTPEACSQTPGPPGPGLADTFSRVSPSAARDPYDQPPMTPRPQADAFGASQMAPDAAGQPRPGSEGNLSAPSDTPMSSPGQQFSSVSQLPGPVPASGVTDTQHTINMSQADTEKLRQRQKLREIILQQQQQKKMAGRQEKGSQDAASVPRPSPLQHWQPESVSQAFSRPPPPYPGSIRPPAVPPLGPRYAVFPKDPRGPYPPEVTGMGMRPHGFRFGFPGGNHGTLSSQERFLVPPQQIQGSGIPPQPRRPMSVDMPRPLNNPPMSNPVGLPQHFPPPGLPVPQHHILGQAFIELRHRAPDGRPRLPFSAPGNILEAPSHPRPGNFIPRPDVPGPRHTEPMKRPSQGLPNQLSVHPSLEQVPPSQPEQGHPVHSSSMVIRSLSHPFSGEFSEASLSTSTSVETTSDNLQVTSQSSDGLEEKLDSDDPSVKELDVKDLEGVEVKDLDDEDLENLNLDTEDGKGDELDTLGNLETNDPNLDDLLRSGEFDIIAYTDPELDLGDKKSMFNAELDLNVPIDDKLDNQCVSIEPKKKEQEDKTVVPSDKHSPWKKSTVTSEIKTEVLSPNSKRETKCESEKSDEGKDHADTPCSQAAAHTDLQGGDEAPPQSCDADLPDKRALRENAGSSTGAAHGPTQLPAEDTANSCGVTGSTPVLSSLLANEKSDTPDMEPLGSPPPALPVSTSSHMPSLPPPLMTPPGHVLDTTMNSNVAAVSRVNHAFPQSVQVNPGFLQGQPAVNHGFGTGKPMDQTVPLSSQSGPPPLVVPPTLTPQSRERPLLLDEQPLLLQDLLDQERQEQQQQRQMQAMIRQRSEPFFPNIDFDAITDPIMKAKMVALKGINKVMAQNNMGMPPMVMNRFPFMGQSVPGAQTGDGQTLLPQAIPQDGSITHQLSRPNPPNFGPGFVNDSQRKQYEEWLQETQQLLQMQQKYLEEQIGAHRKSKKALSAKQRTAKKAGREFPEEDAEQLKHVTEQQSMVQKQLEQQTLGAHTQGGFGCGNNQLPKVDGGSETKKPRGKRTQRTGEKAAPRSKKRRKDEEEKQAVCSSSDAFTHLKQQLSLLPLMEPIIGVNFAHFLPYGSGQFNSGNRLLGTFGSATLDGVSDYYSQLIYKQNNLSNPPTPPASLPPTPPPVACQKMANGFATTEELAGKAGVLVSHEVTKSLGPKPFHLPFRPQDDLLARAIAQGPKTVDVPASLPTPPHNNQEELRMQDHSADRDSPDSFVPSSSPESVVGVEVRRYPDLSLVKEEPPEPVPSPIIPILPSSAGKGSESRRNDIKTEPGTFLFSPPFGSSPNGPRSGLISVAITLHPAAAENIGSVVAAFSNLLHVRIPNSYEVSNAPDSPSVGLINSHRVNPGLEYRQHLFLRGPPPGSANPPRLASSYRLKPPHVPFPPTSNGLSGYKDAGHGISESEALRTRWCCHCKVVVLGGGVRKSLRDLAFVSKDSCESSGRVEKDIVFCSNNCFILYSSTVQAKISESKDSIPSLPQSPIKETPSRAFHQYSNNISTLDVHCLPQLQEDASPPASPPINFPPAFEAAKVEAKPDELKVTVKLKPRLRTAPGGFEDCRPVSKKWRGMKWKKWSIHIVIPKGTFPPPCENEIDEFLKKLGTSLKPDPVPRDYRKCCFCHEEGDGLTDGPARLLNLDLDLWVHLNCALWSTEVYETQAGALINVELALRRGLHMKCVFCHKMGATSGCHRLRCTNIYHFTCAMKAQCMFFKDKTMLCPMHKPKGIHEQELSYFAVFRRVYVQRDEVRQIASIVQRGERDHTFRVGSLIFHTIGQLLPQQMQAFHSPKALFPVGYEASRLYWSTRYANRRCRYLCSIEEKDGRPVFVIRIVEQGHEDLVLSDTSPKGVWDKILEPVACVRKQSEMLQLFPAYLKGEDLFGLTVSAVARIAESLPGVEACENYTFRYGRNPLMELPLAVNPTGCARSEPKMSAHVKRFVLRPHTLNSTSTSKSFQSTVTGELNAPYSKQFVHSKSSQYRRMKTEWKSSVYLARSRIQGLGLYAARDIEKHTMVIEYIGTIIRNEVANRKEKLYESQNRGVYMFRMDNDHVIDATLTGGPARYINHSCAPNCVAEVVTFERGHKIIISSNRRIQKGEELCYDYKFDFEDDQHKIPCHCGAVNCRKWMN